MKDLKHESDLILVSGAVLGQEFDSDVYNDRLGHSLEPGSPLRKLSQHTRWAVLKAGHEWGGARRPRWWG